MKALAATAFALLLMMAGGVYYHFYYPPVVLKHRTQDALQTFAAAVATKDRSHVSNALKVLLADDAKIHLEVTFFAIIQTAANKPMMQDFDKESFIEFLDNVLYPLSDYSYTPTLEMFQLVEDQQSAAITFTSKEWADGASLFGGVSVDMRYSSETVCEGTARFAGEVALLSEAYCKLTLRTVPKPGQAQKIQNSSDAMREYLQR